MLVLRANVLAKGFSGVRVELLELLVGMLNAGVHPVIPEKGSVGASGDLAPLAHLALVVVGEGEAVYRGERIAGLGLDEGKIVMGEREIRTEIDGPFQLAQRLVLAAAQPQGAPHRPMRGGVAIVYDKALTGRCKS